MPDPFRAPTGRVALVVTRCHAFGGPLCRALSADGARLAVAGASVLEVSEICAELGRDEAPGAATALPYLMAPGADSGPRRLVAAVMDDLQRIDALAVDATAGVPAAALVAETARAMARGGRAGRIVVTGPARLAARVRRWADAPHAHGITVNLLAPGPRATAEDLAAGAALLLSPLAGGITGQAIGVDGSRAPRR
ncbi:hypothetical protein AB0D66_23375 [Streptomyces sp. NPDC048270]|uniref:hypothetical protein n=1 Tax=Streptomyces sp. NPDC048270 TaxID=3154615 RepID=UPI0033CBFB89